MTEQESSFTLSRGTRRTLTGLTAAGLGVDAYVHWHLAANFDTLTGTASPHISQGELFRLEAALALIAMLLVLATRRRLAAAVAFLIAAGGLGALLLYGYVDVGGFGPVPDMYDPIWYTEKTISAVAEAVAAVGALCLFLWHKSDKGSRQGTVPGPERNTSRGLHRAPAPEQDATDHERHHVRDSDTRHQDRPADRR